MRTCLVFMSIACLPVPALAAGDDAPWTKCGLADHRTAEVVSVTDDYALKLTDGKTIKLVGIDIPAGAAARSNRSRPKNARQSTWPNKARRMIERYAVGNPVTVWFGSRPGDRHDRLRGHVFAGGKDHANPVWLQRQLVRNGFARVFADGLGDTCSTELTHEEAKANRTKRGLWRDGNFAIRSAKDPKLTNFSGSYQIIDGFVLSVGERKRWTYLNFGRDWAKDFTVALPRRAVRAFQKKGIDPASFRKRRVQVRGWLDVWNGPAIIIGHPDQIEILSVR